MCVYGDGDDYNPADEYDVIGDESLTLEEVMIRTAQRVDGGLKKHKLTSLREEINEWEVGDREASLYYQKEPSGDAEAVQEAVRYTIRDPSVCD